MVTPLYLLPFNSISLPHTKHPGLSNYLRFKSDRLEKLINYMIHLMVRQFHTRQAETYNPFLKKKI